MVGASSGGAVVGWILVLFEKGPFTVPGPSDFLRLGADWLREGAMCSEERKREKGRASCIGGYGTTGRGSSPAFTSNSVSKSRESLSKLSKQES